MRLMRLFEEFREGLAGLGFHDSFHGVRRKGEQGALRYAFILAHSENNAGEPVCVNINKHAAG